MSQWILKSNGKVVPWHTVRPLQIEEINSDTEREKRRLFDQLIERRWGQSMNGTKRELDDSDIIDNELELYNTLEERAKQVPSMDDTVDASGRLINQQPIYDNLLNAEVQLHVSE